MGEHSVLPRQATVTCCLNWLIPLRGHAGRFIFSRFQNLMNVAVYSQAACPDRFVKGAIRKNTNCPELTEEQFPWIPVTSDELRFHNLVDDFGHNSARTDFVFWT